MGAGANGHLAIYLGQMGTWEKWAPRKTGAIIWATGHWGKLVFGALNWTNKNF